MRWADVVARVRAIQAALYDLRARHATELTEADREGVAEAMRMLRSLEFRAVERAEKEAKDGPRP